jgi:hypothetical protein
MYNGDTWDQSPFTDKKAEAHRGFQEVNIMNSPTIEHPDKERLLEIAGSVEFFILLLALISVLGFICFAAV